MVLPSALVALLRIECPHHGLRLVDPHHRLAGPAAGIGAGVLAVVVELLAVDELAAVVDEEATVGVAVEGDAQVRAFSSTTLFSTNARFSGSSGLGS